MNIDINALTSLAKSANINVLDLYNKVVGMNPSIEWYCKEDAREETPAVRTVRTVRRTINRKDRKYILRDKAKHGQNRWHHADKMYDSHSVFGLKRIQDLKWQEKERMERKEAQYTPTTILGDTLNDALWKYNPYIYRSVEGYTADVLNAVAEAVDLTDDIIEYVKVYAENEYNDAIKKRDMYLQAEKHLLWEIQDTEVQLDNLLRELDETREELALMF